MDIVLCCDNNFVMPTGVTMYSVCANNCQCEEKVARVRNNNVRIKYYIILTVARQESNMNSLIVLRLCQKSQIPQVRL